MSLRIESTNSGDTTTLVLRGAIDEHSDLTGLPKLDGKVVVMDMTGVERINSVGINRWLPVMRELSANRSVRVVRLSYAASIHAANITNLFGSAVIESCLAPYYCSGCGATPTLEVTATEYSATRQPPSRQCPKCSAALEFDELEEYLSFLSRSAA